MDKKRVYTFGNGQAEGKADMKNLLGGKGANLAEMNLIGVPVPPGFTITTEVCTEYNEMGQEKVVALLKGEVESAIAKVEELMSSKFGDIENPWGSFFYGGINGGTANCHPDRFASHVLAYGSIVDRIGAVSLVALQLLFDLIGFVTTGSNLCYLHVIGFHADG